MEIIKVSSKSNPKGVALTLSNILNNEKSLEIHVIGAGSLNQAIKGIIISKGILAPSGKNIRVIPSFLNVNINNDEKTGVKLLIESI